MVDPVALKYRPSYETPSPDEARIAGEIAATMRTIQQKTWSDGHGALRPVHAKSHGLLRGELEVLPGLAPELAQGLFAAPARYPVVLRLSTIPGDLLDDSVSLPRGLALKVFDVPGARLPGSDSEATQDFILVNGEAFVVSDGSAFAKGLKLLAATTDRAESLKKLLSLVMRGAERIVEVAGGESAVLRGLGGQPMTHPLGDTFHSQTAFLYGEHIAKFAVAPLSPSLVALCDAPLPRAGEPDALRSAVVDHFASCGADWEFRVQLCTDLAAMPIEDAIVPWPERLSPFRAVARLRVPPQPAWDDERVDAIDRGMAFSPWTGLAAHRPLGSLNRLRRLAYADAQQFRAERSGCPLHGGAPGPSA